MFIPLYIEKNTDYYYAIKIEIIFILFLDYERF